MFDLSTLRSPRPHNFLFPAIVLVILSGIPGAGADTAAVDKPVRWTSSPLKSLAGEPLPAATSYEVWLTETGRTEYLAASVNDTTYTLRAAPGVTYQVRVRGVSAQGLKSSFSEMSAPYKSPAASTTPPALAAGLGHAYPNPFNARTTIPYVVPENLSAAAPLAMEIYDARGRRLRVFELDRRPGSHLVPWDGHDGSGAPVPAGLYLARFVCGPYTARAKLTLLP